MRLELALIVGILFFCSWCAYIVARMNSSVNGDTSAGAGASASSSLSPVAPASSRGVDGGGAGSLIGHASTRAEHQSRLVPGAQSTPSTGVYTAGRNWPPYVSSTGGGGGGVNTVAAGNYPTHAASASSVQPLHGLQQWQSYALPTAHAADASAPAHASQPLMLDYSGGQQLAAAGGEEDSGQGDEGEALDDEGGVVEYPQTDAASGEEPVEGEEEGEDEGEGVQGEVEPGQRLAPPQTELEEVANRRSFNEIQSDLSERDKDGRVVVTKRRHLINGRPVRARPADRGEAGDTDQGQGESLEDEEGNVAASSRVPLESAPGGASGQSEADFEKLVDEIDQEDKLRKRAQAAEVVAVKPEVVVSKAGGVAVAQSRAHGTKLAPAGETRALIGRRLDRDTPPLDPPGSGLKLPAVTGAIQRAARTSAKRAGHAESGDSENKNRDSHEHSLQESLQAQQWDDDSATSGGAAIAPETAPEIGNEEDQEEVSNIVERDQEARRLARMSRDLLLSPERVSHELDQEEDDKEQEQERRRRRRRKRELPIIRSSVPSSSSSSSSSQSISLGSLHNTLGSLAAPPAPVPAMALANDTQPTREREGHNGTTTASTSGREVRLRKPLGPLKAEIDGRQTGQLFEGAPAASPSLAAGGQGAREQVALRSNSSSAATASNNSTKDDDSQNQSHVKNATSEQQMSSAEDMHVEVLAEPPAATTATAAATGSTHSWPPLVAVSSGGAPLNGHAHQSGPELASGSHKIKSEAKRVKGKKRKKKYKKASKSKMVDSKYKAARAYARKHASRTKKGQMRKKKRKSEKNLIAHRKHFKGATRGNKFARGGGAHGAKKRANFYKDKGYKKRGFKKAYHKLETGDHKTYFDEFRDKDHSKKWKNFDDRHKYAQRKKWAGSDSRHVDRHKLKLAKARASKAGQWRASAANKHVNEMDKYKKSKKSSSKSGAVKSSANKKKKKKKKVVEKR